MGLAVGDAVGTTLEFKSPRSFKPITDMVGGGAFALEPGQWTDDTSMALCLAESLLECNGFDVNDQMKRYLKWYEEGYLSSTGECFDIGNTIATALNKFKTTNNPFAGVSDTSTAGNGSLMRLAPIPLFYSNKPAEAYKYAGDSSRTTHAAIASIDACKYMCGLIMGALNGVSKEEILSERYSPISNYWNENPLTEEIDRIAKGSFKITNPPYIIGSGYVVKTLEASLWAFHNSKSFEEGCLKVINLGDDADTTGAVYGQLAGAFYGINGIPFKWKEKIYLRTLIETFADKLFNLSEEIH